MLNYFKITRQKERKLYFSMMTTNGSLLTPSNWERLKKDHVTGYQITLDGLERTHDSQRKGRNGEPTWQTIVNNLRYFRNCVKTNTMNIAIRTNITKDIYDQRKEYLDFLKREFGQDRRFHFFFHLAQDWGNIDSEIKKSFCGTDEFYEVIRCAAECGLPLNIHDMFMRPGARICFAAKKNAFLITSDGAIRKCSGHLYKPYNYLGNIDNPNKLDEKNTKFWSSMNKKEPKECLDCKKLPLCYGLVCPAYHGPITETCGYDQSQMEKMITALYGKEEKK